MKLVFLHTITQSLSGAFFLGKLKKEAVQRHFQYIQKMCLDFWFIFSSKGVFFFIEVMLLCYTTFFIFPSVYF